MPELIVDLNGEVQGVDPRCDSTMQFIGIGVAQFALSAVTQGVLKTTGTNWASNYRAFYSPQGLAGFKDKTVINSTTAAPGVLAETSLSTVKAIKTSAVPHTEGVVSHELQTFHGDTVHTQYEHGGLKSKHPLKGSETAESNGLAIAGNIAAYSVMEGSVLQAVNLYTEFKEKGIPFNKSTMRIGLNGGLGPRIAMSFMAQSAAALSVNALTIQGASDKAETNAQVGTVAGAALGTMSNYVLQAAMEKGGGFAHTNGVTSFTGALEGFKKLGMEFSAQSLKSFTLSHGKQACSRSAATALLAATGLFLTNKVMDASDSMFSTSKRPILTTATSSSKVEHEVANTPVAEVNSARLYRKTYQATISVAPKVNLPPVSLFTATAGLANPSSTPDKPHQALVNTIPENVQQSIKKKLSEMKQPKEKTGCDTSFNPNIK